MNPTDIKELKKELRGLLEKYDVSIGFTCSDSSDTYGLYDDHVVIQTNKGDINIVESDNWWLSAYDLK